MRLYISGPIVGHPDDNRPAFETAKTALHKTGAGQVIIPHNIVRYCGYCSPKGMRFRLREVSYPYLDGVAVLPGWEDSYEARLEVEVAKACGIPCKTVDEWMEGR